MRYTDFRDVVEQELRRHPTGLTWAELKQRLDLPYDRPWPAWVRQMSREVGLSKSKGSGRAYLWKVDGPVINPVIGPRSSRRAARSHYA